MSERIFKPIDESVYKSEPAPKQKQKGWRGVLWEETLQGNEVKYVDSFPGKK